MCFMFWSLRCYFLIYCSVWFVYVWWYDSLLRGIVLKDWDFLGIWFNFWIVLLCYYLLDFIYLCSGCLGFFYKMCIYKYLCIMKGDWVNDKNMNLFEIIWLML